MSFDKEELLAKLVDDNDPSLIGRRAYLRARAELKDYDPAERRDRYGRWAREGARRAAEARRVARTRSGDAASGTGDVGTALPQAPRIDTRQSPDDPMKFHGFRIARGGDVYASTTPAVGGRSNANYETHIGSVQKRGRMWVARSPGGTEFQASTQSAAGKRLLEWTQARENALRSRIAKQRRQ